MEALNILNSDTINLLSRNNLLLPLIKSELVKEAISSINLTDQEKENIKLAIISKNKLTSEEEFNKWIDNQGISNIEFFNKVSEPMRLNKYCLKEYGHIVERKFLERKDDLEQITYSLIRVKDYNLASELFLRIKEGEASFGELASSFSLGPEKDTKGIIGPISLTKSHPGLTEVLKSSKVGNVVKPFLLQDFWLIVRLESLKKSTLDKEMESKMSQELFNDNLEEKSKIVLNKLLQNSKIENV